GTAIGIWAGVSALALAVGPLVGGLLTEHLSWNWIFFVNVPIGVLGVGASFVFIDESRDETHERLDLPGLAASAVGLFALTYALIEANTYGWGSGRIVTAFAVAAAGLVTFWLLERHQRAPMLALDLFRSGTFTGANLVTLLVALAMFGVFFFVSLYMQNVLGYSAVQAGAAFLPMTVMVIVVAPLAGRTTDRFGSRWLMTVGMVLVSVQLVYFSRLGEHARYWELLPALFVGGIGMAMTMTPSAAAATRSVPVDKAGVGSAVLNAARQVGGSVGIAVMGAIMAHETGGRRTPAAFMDGFSLSLVVAAGIAVVGAAVAFALVRPHRMETAEVARAAGVSEPILYRHFESKKQLYFACLEEAWSGLRDSLRASIDELGVVEAYRLLGPTTMRRLKAVIPSLWMQAITEAGSDPEIRRFVSGHMREVHDFFAETLAALQREGAIPPDRDPSAEAWILVAGSLLVSFADRLGGVLTEADLA